MIPEVAKPAEKAQSHKNAEMLEKRSEQCKAQNDKLQALSRRRIS